jgi:hypothetical protein
MAFAQSSERRTAPGASPPQLPATSTLASHGIRSECAPPPTSSMRVHSRRCCHRLRTDGDHPANRVPPSWFLTTSTVCSALRLPGLLHPGAGRGSPRFCGRPLLASIPTPEGTRPAASSVPRAFPRRVSHPPKKSPRPQHTAFPRLSLHLCRPLPPRRWCSNWPANSKMHSQLAPLDLEAFLRCRVRSARPVLPRDDRPLLPWALRPSRVLARW